MSYESGNSNESSSESRTALVTGATGFVGGEILMASGVPTAALQAGVVIGSESLSFKLLRHVTERVPAFIAPDWITNEITRSASAISFTTSSPQLICLPMSTAP